MMPETGRRVAMIVPRIAVLIVAFAVAGCSNTGLRDLRSNSSGPDEFLVQPSKPLIAPENYASLPPPTPGGTNRVDQQPKADAVVALGGRASALVPQGVAASDGSLVNHASRYGVTSNIRVSLAEEDEQFRKRRGRFTSIRLFRTDRYDLVYRRVALDPFAETRRFRRAGIRTPASPPESN
jgi:hypothetical protein